MNRIIDGLDAFLFSPTIVLFNQPVNTSNAYKIIMFLTFVTSMHFFSQAQTHAINMTVDCGGCQTN